MKIDQIVLWVFFNEKQLERNCLSGVCLCFLVWKIKVAKFFCGCFFVFEKLHWHICT